MRVYPLVLIVLVSSVVLTSCWKKDPIQNPPITCNDPAQVQNGSIVTMTLSGSMKDGPSIDTWSGTQVIRIGSGRLPKWLERLLACKKAWDTIEGTLTPDEAYGPATQQTIYTQAAFWPDQDKVREDHEYEIAPNLKVKVLEIDGDKVTVEEPNPNPLGGKTLIYKATIANVSNPAR